MRAAGCIFLSKKAYRAFFDSLSCREGFSLAAAFSARAFRTPGMFGRCGRPL